MPYLRVPRGLRLLSALSLLALPAAVAAQEILTPGEWASGVLEVSDPTDADGFIYDAYHLPEGVQGLFSVTVESEAFDTYVEWGVMGGGAFMVVAENDDFPGLTSLTDSRTYAVVGAGERPEIRIFSLEGGPDGAYRVRVDVLPLVEPEPAWVAYGADVDGTLGEGDAFSDGAFVDRYTFRGAAGDVVKMALEAEFDAYLQVLDAEGTFLAEDDDGLGGTDSYIELEIPADGTYRVEVTSFMVGVGTYRFRMGPDLDVEPAPGAGAAALLTDEERAGLQYDGERVWNDALGFSLPSPGADFTPMPESDVALLMGDGAPNVHMWVFQDVLETAQLMIMVIKAGQPVDVTMVQLIGEMMVQSTGATVDEETLDWEGSRSLFATFTVGTESAELRCTASPEERQSGIIVCVMGVSTDGWSFREVLDGLEVR